MSKPRRRRSRRRTRRNPHYVVVNGLRRVRRLLRNAAAGDVVGKVVLPALAGTGGLLAARWLSDRVASKIFPGQDPKLLQVGTSLAGGFASLVIGEKFGLAEETTEAVAVGMGIAGALPFLPKELMDSQPMTTSAAPSATAPASATSGLGAIGQPIGRPIRVSRAREGLLVDVRHAGAPYRGMLGLGDDACDPADMSMVDDVMSKSEAVSIIEPTDVARHAEKQNPTPRVRETMASPGDRGYAGGTFSRHLFSGMTGG